MSIRPVDLQLMVPGSTEVGKITNNEARRPDVLHHQFSEQLQKQTEHNNQHVMQANKSEHANIDKDGKGNNQQRQSKQRDEKKKNETKDRPKSKSTSMFDVSI